MAGSLTQLYIDIGSLCICSIIIDESDLKKKIVWNSAKGFECHFFTTSDYISNILTRSFRVI